MIYFIAGFFFGSIATMILYSIVVSERINCYMFNRIEEEYVGRMFDSQLNSMMKDLVEVLHDLEWWQSCDCDEKRYREKVTKFKKKWFKQTKIDVQKQIESELERTKNELLKEFDYLKDDENEHN